MNPELGLGGRRLTGKKAIISLGLEQWDFCERTREWAADIGILREHFGTNVRGTLNSTKSYEVCIYISFIPSLRSSWATTQSQ